METHNNTADKVLGILLKEQFAVHTATSLARALRLTRQGIWRLLNKLTENKLIILKSIGNSKTSTVTIRLNWSNPVTEKTVSLLLTKESLKQQRWRVNFEELENNVEFLILFGSILNNPKEANDLDLLAIAGRKRSKAIEEITLKIQQTLLKKIHLVDLTKAEFYQELRKQNKAYIDAVKKGVILYGQDNFIKFVREFNERT